MGADQGANGQAASQLCCGWPFDSGKRTSVRNLRMIVLKTMLICTRANWRSADGRQAMGPLSIEEVLAAEAIALNGAATAERAGDLRPQATEQDAQSRRMKKDADVRSGADENPDEVETRKAFYRSLNKLNRAALSLSGGGIRSATFCLGVIQALAACDVAPAQADEGEKSANALENALNG